MSEFQRIKLKQFAKVQDRETSEARYWKSFAITKEDHLQGSPNCIDFNPVRNGQFIVTAATSVHLYEGADRVQRSYTRFSADAFSGKFRKDGKLLTAGDASGLVKVFDVPSKSLLRQLKGHSLAVRATVWSYSGLHILSGSDDQSIRLWDLGTEETTWKCKQAHSDYVRTLCAHTTAHDVFVSGSYDHTVKVWDSRQSRCTNTFTHGSPVEKCVMSQSGTIVYSAGGNEVKLWDTVSGKLLHTFASHQKNVTDLCLDPVSPRILSSGLDGHVKIYNLESLQVSHGIKCTGPVLSVAVSPQDRKLVVGLVDGSLVVRTRENAGAVPGTLIPGELQGEGARRRHYKGAGSALQRTADDMVETERSAKLRPFEVQLKRFSYQQALDSALKTRNPLVVVTVLEELCRRSGLTVALSGRDEASLEPLLAFCARYVSHPRYTRLIVQVAHRILDLYGAVLGHSDAIDELFHKLRQQVKAEITFHRQTMHVMGSLDEIVNTSLLHSARVDITENNESMQSV
mmetsp:Transcript_26676/g.39635  ORF Transcript_26676/g.39635 Transcript_26676/m.39635 type:complete len:514 (+) Transcript_26676:122-1663(+)|eukprot:CAMPEP_0185030612 /NCGR_PEP_ID=MMETSP1103-20130426/17587_1 /TAXON_ID=36769 /ORGANISM="Paraphysomonas bandaiensis, Strain Caron Lab Isolate" /LENGTH=513 /DNA_ID=CAMNT_0027565809 /DNA_START=72 /DNA_END=1613 /DNA_ORIENTATION=-